MTEKNGELTGEVVYSYQPKGILIIGKFGQFKNDHGINQTKLQSFELFRRSINNIEVITFDEFYERVKRIVLKTSVKEPK